MEPAERLRLLQSGHKSRGPSDILAEGIAVDRAAYLCEVGGPGPLGVDLACVEGSCLLGTSQKIEP